MKQYDVKDAKSHFSELVNLALQGEEVVIARDNHPVVKLTPVTAMKKEATSQKPLQSHPEDIDEYS